MAIAQLMQGDVAGSLMLIFKILAALQLIASTGRLFGLN